LGTWGAACCAPTIELAKLLPEDETQSPLEGTLLETDCQFAVSPENPAGAPPGSLGVILPFNRPRRITWRIAGKPGAGGQGG